MGLVLAVAGCGGIQSLESRTPARAVTVDGQAQEWGGVLQPVGKNRVSLGVQNDGTYLYLSFVARQPEVVGQIVRSGLEVWFDPEGGKEKAFGIKFPLGLVGAGRPGDATDGPPEGGRLRDSERMRERFHASLVQMEILGAEGQSLRFGVTDIPGIEARALLEQEVFTYELRVPLRHSDTYRYAVGAGTGGVLGLGFETPELDREALRERMGERGGMGGRGGMDGGMMDGGMGGGRGGYGGMQGLGGQEALKLWTRVQLAR